MYKVENFSKEIGIEEYVSGYVNAAEFEEYCKACPNYGSVWSCPPYDFDAEEYWKGFSSLYLTARKIIFEAGTNREKGEEIMLQVKKDMAEELYRMEEEYPGSRGLSAGSCGLCREEGCTRTADMPCRHPDLMRYSIESLGGNVGLTVRKLMGIELEWITEGRLPDYFVLVGGLLKK